MSDLLQHIASGATVLTVNSRLSRHLLSEYEQWQLKQGSTHWPTPQIVPWNGWVQRQWQALAFVDMDLPTLLAEEAALALWERVIESSQWGKLLLNSQATARAAMQAWRLLRQWQLQPAVLAHEEGADTVAFYAWAEAFQKRCHKERWLDEAALPNQIAAHLLTANSVLPLNFSGLDLMT